MYLFIFNGELANIIANLNVVIMKYFLLSSTISYVDLLLEFIVVRRFMYTHT